MHTSAHTIRGSPTLKDLIERFRKGSFRELKEKSKALKLISSILIQSNAIHMNSNDTQRNLNVHSTEYCSTNCCENHNLKLDVQFNEGDEETAMLKSHKDKLVSTPTKYKELLDIKVNWMIILIDFVCINLFNYLVFDTIFMFAQLAIILSLLIVHFSVVFMNVFVFQSMNDAIVYTFSDCDILEKAVQLSVIVYENNKESVSIKDCRSRYEKFISFNCVITRSYAIRRDREPSRIPVKQLARALQKTRKTRRLVRKYIKKNVPTSSRIHLFTKRRAFSREEGCRKPVYKSKLKRSTSTFTVRTNGNWFVTHQKRSRKTITQTINLKSSNPTTNRPNNLNESAKLNSVGSVYKNLNHRVNHSKFNLCRDVEKNPGPVINPANTICAPYSQANVALFGSNAGRQCVAMSLTGLIYNYRNAITTSMDLVSIMSVGNELYSYLSRLSRQSYLMLSEIPEMITMFDTDYQLQYSQSYTGNIHSECTLEDFSFVMSLDNAFQTLLRENYNSLLLTVGCSTVGIYHTMDAKFKIIDSHARDSFGMPHPQGTCVLLEVQNLNELVNYFQVLYNDSSVLYELKGLHINETHQIINQSLPPDVPEQTITYQSNHNSNVDIITGTSFLKHCFAISFYCICFSIIKPCGYWDSQTFDSIIDHGNMFYRVKLDAVNHVTINDLPNKIQIYDADIDITFTIDIEGILCCTSRSVNSRLVQLQHLITDNTKGNTGFLIWLSNYCVSCIFQNNLRNKTNTKYYLTVFSENGKCDVFQSINDINSLINAFANIVKDHFQSNEISYYIKFLSCSSQLSNVVRQKVMRKHKSLAKKRLISNREKDRYAEMEPIKKRRYLSSKVEKYKSLNATEKANRYKTLDPIEKEKLLSDKAEWYRSLDIIEKEKLLSHKAEWYRSLDIIEKEKLLSHKAEWYRSLDPTKREKLLLNKRSYNRDLYYSLDTVEKEKLLQDKAEWYKSLDPSKKQELNTVNNRRKEKKSLQSDLDHYISSFQNKIRDGPYYICTVCNRMLYRKTVIQLNENKYSSLHNLFTGIKSFDEKQYICKTCHVKVLKGQIPCQAIYNKLQIDEIPPELSVLEKLEQILIAQRIVFEKIVVMPKGKQRKIKGAICNVPVECDQTCTVLPRPPERSGIILLKLKRKLEFRGHVYFQAVRPQVILQALNWLKLNNPLYTNVAVDTDNIDTSLATLQLNDSISEHHTNGDDSLNDTNVSDITTDHQNTVNSNTSDNEEGDDPLNEYRAPTNETCLQSVIPDYPVNIEQDNVVSSGNEIFSIAPAENKHPVSFMMDKQCEELAFPVLFPTGQFGYTVQREIKLSPVKYFNARLLHCSGRFATNPEYLFFAQFIIEQKKVSDSINIALTKVHGQSLTASQLTSNVQSLQNIICQDQGYLFLRHIPGTPPYWQKFMYEVVAMVKQLGIPTWFMTLSCADLRWPELFQIIARTQGKNMTNEEVDALSYNERCSMLNLNPVVVAKHFQYRVETFFTEVLLSNANPIGKIVYYALRIEFQMRGSPHLHALIWTSDCPKLTPDTKQAYINFVDQHVHANLPNKDEDSGLHELVKTYQKHNHSKTCRKYKNISCRFNFGQFFTNRTIVAEPLSDDLDEEQKTRTIDRHKEILTLVKEKIDDVLNPSRPNYEPTLTETDIFTSVGITEEQYYWALEISPSSDFELHLKRPIDSCFINNYFIAGIKGFAANVDLQPVFNHYKCITYVCSYFTKDETECSQAIMNAAKEAKKENLNIREGLKKIGAAFLSTREVSSQECVYRCMPELWLRKIFPGTLFVSTDLPDKRVRVAKSQKELDELDDESTDIYKSNIIERYSNRPIYIPAVNKLCLAKFAAYYYKDYRKDSQETSDAQPEVLTDDVIELKHDSTDDDSSLPNKIRLIRTNEVMKCRKVMAVIRYHTPSKRKEPELFFHHLLMLYYPWRDETTLLGRDQTYASKFYEPDVQAVVQQNREQFEPDADAVTEALEFLRNNQGNIIPSYDSMNDQENADLYSEIQDDSIVEELFNEQLPSHLDSSSESDQHSNTAIATHNHPAEISDDELRKSVRSLNEKQRYAYDTVLSWCRNKMKNMNSLKPEEVKPIYLFVTGGAGAGKSHLIKTIYHTATKTFRHAPMNPELPTVLLMAPTGVAAINIEGTTINTALSIPKETGDILPAMSDQKKTLMRMSLSELKLIIIDEISMVANTTLLHIHQRLKEIFGTNNSQLFAGISIIAVGDMYQLPPIRKKPVFENYKNEVYNLYHPWHLFTMIELIEIMRQKDDQPFAELLNRFRTGSQTEEDIRCIQSRSIDPSDDNYPSDALHIWAENSPVNEYNNTKLDQIAANRFHLKATDQYPPNVTKQDIDRVLVRGRSDTGGLDSDIYIKENARVMLTTNVDIGDRLINGQMGTVIKIGVNSNTQKPSIIYIKFDDDKAGHNLITKCTNTFTKENRAVPIQPVLTRIKVRPGKPSSPEIQRVQFPITLAYACTVHKVQGLSLANVVISFDLVRQRSFNYGQVYVALSRSTSLNGIHILGQIEAKHVKTDGRVHKEYERLRNISSLTMQPTNQTLQDKTILTMCLLNVRSLRKHSIDIMYDLNILNSDIIALTETQLLPQSNDTEIKTHLHPFLLHRQDHPSDRFSSLALCTNHNIEVQEHEYFHEINAIRFVILNSITQLRCNILLLYRKNSSNVFNYINGIRQTLHNHAIDVILGDFNINYLNDNDIQPLKTLMNSLNYSQIVQSPTFISAGSTIDHIYLKLDMFDVILNSVVSIYYSDHDAIKISIKFKSQ